MAMTTASATPALWHETAGNGPPLVLLPGGPGLSHDYLRPHLDPLAEVATLVWLDLPGTGRSPIDGDVGQITHKLWIDELEALRKHLEFDRWTVFGHSYGGWIAVEYALTHPESIAGLVLSASAPSGAHLATLIDRIPDDLPKSDRQVLEQLLAGDVADCDLEARIRDTARIFLLAEPEPLILESIRLDSETFKHVFGNCLPELAIEDRLNEVTAPTLVVAADCDWQCPWEVSGRLAVGIPSAMLATMPEAGHYPFIDQPEVFTQIVTRCLRSGVMS